ncbi:hypothetical protein SUGI_0132900 [Cryptomeria japonica]|nr:hypothetical protein SUGI_0132900 [Cryptomeria japonica]
MKSFYHQKAVGFNIIKLCSAINKSILVLRPPLHPADIFLQPGELFIGVFIGDKAGNTWWRSRARARKKKSHVPFFPTMEYPLPFHGTGLS